jgi:TonB family protein
MGTDPGRQPNEAGTKKRMGKVSATMPTEADANAKMEMDKMGYYNRTEVLPAYNGGQAALENYINNNIEYPQDAIDNNIEGTVSVQFAVDEQGSISNVSTIGTKAGYGLEEQAIKVISNMPKWTAGQIKGKNVKTWRILPITYKLES